jgi:hypothetical protein
VRSPGGLCRLGTARQVPRAGSGYHGGSPAPRVGGGDTETPHGDAKGRRRGPRSDRAMSPLRSLPPAAASSVSSRLRSLASRATSRRPGLTQTRDGAYQISRWRGRLASFSGNCSPGSTHADWLCVPAASPVALRPGLPKCVVGSGANAGHCQVAFIY